MKNDNNPDAKGIKDNNNNILARFLSAISSASIPSEIAMKVAEFDEVLGFQFVHLGMYRVDEQSVRVIIFSRQLSGTSLAPGMFSEELKLAVCQEAEALMRPFDLITHEFTSLDGSMFNGLRAIAAGAGINELMIIPMQIRNTMTIAIAHFPNKTYAEQAQSVLSTSYQLSFATFDRFPYLTKWPDHNKLSKRELEILEYTAEGLKEIDIGISLGISAHTVRNHIENIKRKLEAKNKPHAVSIALRDTDLKR